MLEVKKLSDEKIQDMFDAAFADQVADDNNIDQFESKCIRDVNGKGIDMHVMVVGLAGSPIADDFKKKRLTGIDEVVVDVEGRGEITFELVPQETISLNTNDYNIVYRMAL